MEKTVTLEEALKRIEELEKENAELREELEYYRNRKLSGRQKHLAGVDTCLIFVVGHEVLVGLVHCICQAVRHEGVLVQRRVFVEVHFFILGLAHHLCAEFQFVAVLEGKFEVGGEL